MNSILIINGQEYYFNSYKEVIEYIFGNDYLQSTEAEKQNSREMQALLYIKNKDIGIGKDFYVDTEEEYIYSLLKYSFITILEKVKNPIFTKNILSGDIDGNYILVNKYADELLKKARQKNDKQKNTIWGAFKKI